MTYLLLSLKKRTFFEVSVSSRIFSFFYVKYVLLSHLVNHNTINLARCYINDTYIKNLIIWGENGKNYKILCQRIEG